MKKILIEVGHPNDVHQFRALFYELSAFGYEILFAAKSKDITVNLLREYRLPFILLGQTPKRVIWKLISLLYITFRLLKTARDFRPDLILSRVSPHSGIVSKLIKVPHIGFTDTEGVGLLDTLAAPLTNYILTSLSYRKDFGEKHIRYNGYIETWYLHPGKFRPDPVVLDKLGIQEGEKYAIIRFVSWDSHHYRGLTGLSQKNKLKAVDELINYIKIFISSENDLPTELKKYKFHLQPSDMHSALYYAHLYFGESATMASECAHLGTPAIYIDDSKLGYIDDLIDKKLIHKFSASVIGQEQAIEFAIDAAKDEEAKAKQSILRDSIFVEIDDVSKQVANFISNKLMHNMLNIIKEDQN